MEGAATVTSALVSGLTTVAQDASGAIVEVIPVAILVMGAMFVVSVGVKAFKKIGGR